VTVDGPRATDSEGDGAVDADESAPRKRRIAVWQESAILLGLALVLAIVVKTFLVQAYYIPSESMEPGLQGGPGVPASDRILVQKVSYWFGGDPQRGDVIVFKDPGGWLTPAEEKSPTGVASLLSKIGLYPSGGHLVKRVIGTEGDVIECCDDQGRIEVNGQPIDESDYIATDHGPCDGWYPGGGCDWQFGPVPDGKLFVMGDNRKHSWDSRYHVCPKEQDSCGESPFIDTDLVVGKVFALVWPQSRWTWISRADAFDDVPSAG
jgi:signal peptidase I